MIWYVVMGCAAMWYRIRRFFFLLFYLLLCFDSRVLHSSPSTSNMLSNHNTHTRMHTRTETHRSNHNLNNALLIHWLGERVNCIYFIKLKIDKRMHLYTTETRMRSMMWYVFKNDFLIDFDSFLVIFFFFFFFFSFQIVLPIYRYKAVFICKIMFIRLETCG